MLFLEQERVKNKKMNNNSGRWQRMGRGAVETKRQKDRRKEKHGKKVLILLTRRTGSEESERGRRWKRQPLRKVHITTHTHTPWKPIPRHAVIHTHAYRLLSANRAGLELAWVQQRGTTSAWMLPTRCTQALSLDCGPEDKSLAHIVMIIRPSEFSTMACIKHKGRVQ